jgi:predicted metal-dependent hydrolase
LAFRNTREQVATADNAGGHIAIRVSARARRIALRIDAAERKVELVLPSGVPTSDGLRFAAAKQGWIAARLAALPPPAPFHEGAIVPVFGALHPVRRENDAAAPAVMIRDGEIRVRGASEHVARRIRDHLVGMARREFTRRARTLAARIDRKVARVAVRDTKSRWGSCSGRGNLAFSWRLIFAPEWVIDYVVAHEVAHLVEMNHGARFWRVVDSLSPNSVAARAWLKTQRNRLLSYG